MQEEMDKKDEFILNLKQKLTEAETKISKLEQTLQGTLDKSRVKSRMVNFHFLNSHNQNFTLFFLSFSKNFF